MIVEDYSDLALSFESDRLPALAGLAKQMRKSRPGDWYLAGLWKNTFFEDVLWKTSSQAYQYSRPRDSHAPTWPWASVKGRVPYFPPPPGTSSRLGFLQAKLLRATCDPAGVDDTGELESGKAVVEGPLVPTTVLYLLSTEADEEMPSYRLHISGKRARPFYPDYALCEKNADCAQDGEEVFSLALGAIGGYAIYFLVLRRLQRVPCAYERIGPARLNKKYYARDSWVRTTVTII